MTRVLFAAGVAVVLGIAPTLAQDRGTTLRRAVLTGDAVTASRLATSKDIVNSSNSDGATSLMLAAALGQRQIVAVLLQQGADVRATTRDRSVTPLMFAADFGQLEIARMLVDAGADVKAVDGNGYTAVDYVIMPNGAETVAARARGDEVMTFLLDRGAGHKLTANDTLGRLLAIGECDLSSILETAKSEK